MEGVRPSSSREQHLLAEVQYIVHILLHISRRSWNRTSHICFGLTCNRRKYELYFYGRRIRRRQMKYKISVFAGMVVCMGIGILIGRLSTPPALISHPDAPVMGDNVYIGEGFPVGSEIVNFDDTASFLSFEGPLSAAADMTIEGTKCRGSYSHNHVVSPFFLVGGENYGVPLYFSLICYPLWERDASDTTKLNLKQFLFCVNARYEKDLVAEQRSK